MNKTYSPRKEDITRKWFVVDATGIPVGRIAAKVAQILRGKHKPTFSYNMDHGDFVIIKNAEKAVLTGNNKRDEVKYWHTGWPGGLRSVTKGKLMDETPEKYIYKTVWGMIPKTKLGKQIITKLKVYQGEEHPHAAQNPEELKI